MKLVSDDQKINLYYYHTFFQKLRGLMFKKNIDFAIYFKTKGIHTFFMKESIDLCVTDKNNKIIYLEGNLTKNKIRYFKKAKYIYELPTGSIKNYKLGESLIIMD